MTIHVAGNQTGDFDEWVRELVGDLKDDQQDSAMSQINDLIWAAEKADPDGYSDTAFHQLKSDIRAVVRRFSTCAPC